MSGYDFATLRGFEGKRTRLVTTEGEIATIVVHTVFQQENDLSYEVLATNQPQRYSDDTPRTLSVIPFEYIAEISPAE